MKARLFALALSLSFLLASQPSSATSGDLRAGVQVTPPASATFRVVLNGFMVQNESDDDILEGDGRGDEIFITANRWMVNRDGSAQLLTWDDGSPSGSQYIQTKVMGDPNGHPDRVPAGTKSPGQFSNLDDQIGGLQTKDSFPPRSPAVRTREPLTDRPPIILWQGELTQGQNMVEIVPLVWEWDSPTFSASQRAILDGGLLRWFEEHRQKLANHISASDIPTLPASTDPRRLPPSLLDRYGRLNLYDCILLNDKAGTRPIGYTECFFPQTVVLTYDSAMNAVHTANQNKTLQMEYHDPHDNGDYILYLQVEQLTGLRQLVPLQRRTP